MLKPTTPFELKPTTLFDDGDIVFAEIADIGIYALKAAALPELLDVYNNGHLSQTVIFHDGSSVFMVDQGEQMLLWEMLDKTRHDDWQGSPLLVMEYE